MCKIRVGLHRNVAKIAITYLFIVSCFSVLDVSLYLQVAITYHLRENIKSWRAKMLEL